MNPRRIETPDKGIGDTLLIRPDTDVWFLASLLHRIDQLGGFDEGVCSRHGTHVAELRAGDLGAVAKLKDTTTNDTLAEQATPVPPRPQ